MLFVAVWLLAAASFVAGYYLGYRICLQQIQARFDACAAQAARIGLDVKIRTPFSE